MMKFFKKIPVRFLIVFLATLIICFLSVFRILDIGELIFYDLRLRLRPALNVLKDIVIIEIDDTSLEKFGKWPIPRDYHANVLEILKEFGVRAVVFDILFSEESSLEFDNSFASAIKKTQNVYLPIAFELKDKKNKADVIVAGILPKFKDSIFGFGHINTFVDMDGKIRRVPLFIKYKDKLIPQLAFMVASNNLGLNIDNLKFSSNKVIVDNKLVLPLSKNNSLMVNYPNVWEKSFKRFSYLQIIKAYADLYNKKKPLIDLSYLKDKVCFIGLTATGTADLKATPLEKLAPMIILHASIYNSIVKNKFISDVGIFINTLINLGVFFIVILICKKKTFLRALRNVIFFSLCYFFIATMLLVIFGIWVDLFLPIFILGFSYLGISVYKFFEEVEKRRLLEKELDIARKIQESFLPGEIEKTSFFRISYLMQPAKFVAGDLYDVFLLDDNRCGIFIGDVSGKSVPAALIMAQTISFFRIFSRNSDNPAFVLGQLNNQLCKVLEGRFVTALYLILNRKSSTIELACAGHPPIIFYDFFNDRIREIKEASGPPLGILDTVEYENFKENICKKDRILFYTDGVIETRNRKNEDFGIDRLKELFFKFRSFNGNETLQSIVNELSLFSKNIPQYDDISIILLEYV